MQTLALWRTTGPGVALAAIIAGGAAPVLAVECGEVISSPAQLDQDLVCETDPAVTVDGGMLDLNNHGIACAGGTTGIVLDGAASRLRNGIVSGCQTGVLVAGDGGHVVARLTLSVVDADPDDDSGAEGIRVESDRNRMTNNAILLGGTNAIRVNGARNTVLNNVVSTAERGIRIDGDDNHVSMNLIGGVAEGIEVRGMDNDIRANRIAGALDQGIEIRGDGNDVAGNVATDSEGDGISVFSSDNLISNNHVSGNDDDGIILIEGSGGNLAGMNAALGNGTDLTDQNAGCGDNVWNRNTFETADPEGCID